MQKGRILFLNGVTTSGKTSIVETLQEREDIFFYVVAYNLCQEMVGKKISVGQLLKMSQRSDPADVPHGAAVF